MCLRRLRVWPCWSLRFVSGSLGDRLEIIELPGYTRQEKRHISENLGEHWGLGEAVASELISQPLTEKEEETPAEDDEEEKSQTPNPKAQVTNRGNEQ